MNVINELLERGILVDAELLAILKQMDSSLIIDILQQIDKRKFISKKNFIENMDKIKMALGAIKDKGQGESLNIIRKTLESLSNLEKKEVGDDVGKAKVLKSWIIPSRKIVVDDFVKYFQSRFIELKTILQERSDLENLTTLNKISSQKQSITIIGMVYSKRVTKNKNVILELEDLTGRISVLVSVGKEELLKKVKNVVLDEVIAVKCTGNSEILFANDIIFPDAFGNRVRIENEEYAVFISDIHVGSVKFLEENFLKFLQWINGEIGNEQQKELSKKIKYLFILGDNVDGVGVYPGQEALLSINDLKLQYKRLAELLGQIKKDITIFMCPGQHDASRIAEPQPVIDKEYASELHELKNLILVSNPAFVEVGATKTNPGWKVLMYHGASFHSFVDEIEELRLSKAMRTPTKIAKYCLMKRHLSPQHHESDYLPLRESDPFVIKELPDIIATGDGHRSDVSIYNNILLIASSCWQSTTAFEEKIGHEPDPCKVPILNLKTGNVNILDFS
jgi:DNA polymerase II small subunit